ncbi:MAG: Xaa-Pro peptidase family protein [Candidatus Omnitrophota bacterium]|nr:Xaa-Pro peptidase family protein [Candidatus Omnitrophota bacterium]
MRSRIERVIVTLVKERIDAFLITKAANVRYLSGYSGEEAILFITHKRRFFITDSRYALQARKDTKGFTVKIIKSTLAETVRDLARALKVRRLGFECNDLTHAQHERLVRTLPGTEIVPVSDIIEKLRQIKDAGEIRLIRRSVSILERSLIRFKTMLMPGLTERDLAAELEHFIKASGGEKSSFDIIVASGSNSAFPHAHPTNRRIKPNDMVLLDLGVECEGYNSDLTRVFFLGKINPRTKKIYGIVKEANRRSIKAIRSGVKISKIDEIARGFIRKRGFGGYFGHALGHGIGLEVHESPSISGRNHTVLKPGMVFTIEPAVYLPGRGGIRIEDMVLVTKKGCEVLTDGIDK